MRSFSIDLLKNYERPVIELYETRTLIDTGAVIPVFQVPEIMLKTLFNGKCINENGNIGGFGGISYGKVYELKDFKIGDFNFEILQVFVPNDSVMHHPFLLSSTLFYGTSYEFDTINSKFNVKFPDEMSLNRKFEIVSLKGKLYAQIDGVLLQDKQPNNSNFTLEVWPFVDNLY